MPWNFRSAGKKAAMKSGINAVAPSPHPGQSDQLARVQSIVAAEIDAFPNAVNVNVIAYGHRDDNGSVIHVVVQPVKLTNAGETVQ